MKKYNIYVFSTCFVFEVLTVYEDGGETVDFWEVTSSPIILREWIEEEQAVKGRFMRLNCHGDFSLIEEILYPFGIDWT